MEETSTYKSLSSQLSWRVIGTVCLVMFGLIVVLGVAQYQESIDRLRSKSETNLDLISQALETPVWNFDDAGIKNTIVAFADDTDFEYIELLDSKKKVFLSIAIISMKVAFKHFVDYQSTFAKLDSLPTIVKRSQK